MGIYMVVNVFPYILAVTYVIDLICIYAENRGRKVLFTGQCNCKDKPGQEEEQKSDKDN